MVDDCKIGRTVVIHKLGKRTMKPVVGIATTGIVNLSFRKHCFQRNFTNS